MCIRELNPQSENITNELNMRLISESGFADKGKKLVLQAEEKEDLFALYNIINADDELLFRKQVSHKGEKKGEGARKVQVQTVKMRVVSSEFEPWNESLRYKGITVEPDETWNNPDLSGGMFFAFEIDYKYSFTLFKYEYTDFCAKTIKDACNVDLKTDIGAVVLQEGVAHVCAVTPYHTSLKSKITANLAKKKRGVDIMKNDSKLDKFYHQIIENMIRHFDFNKLKLILLCSPGFFAQNLYDNLMAYASEKKLADIIKNKAKIVVAHCSTGYIQSISEVMKNPSYKQLLSETKTFNEAQVFDDFMDHLNKEDFKAWYGLKEIQKANGIAAIDALMISDSLLRSDYLDERKLYSDLTASVERSGGKVIVFSSMNQTGEELNRLTGVACILKYPVYDLDETENDDDSDDSDEDSD
ncbi:hypothetical protein ACO0OL_002037 [Hanseniaspora opuntiae]